MNKKITFPELVDAVATITNTSKRTSETFLKEFFATITEALTRGENVKIKNFGVFKLVEVGERKSVNVNTGEEMQIPSHVKVSFTPDKSLADSINTPFASFETVVLSEDLSEDDLRKLSSYDKIETEIVEKSSEESLDNEEIVVPPPFNPHKNDEGENFASDEQASEGIESDKQLKKDEAVVDGQSPVDESIDDAQGEKEESDEIGNESEHLVKSDSETIEKDARTAEEQQKELEETDETDCKQCQYYKYSRYYRRYSRRKNFAKGFLCGSVTMLFIAGIAAYAYLLLTTDYVEPTSSERDNVEALVVNDVVKGSDTTIAVVDSVVKKVEETPVLRYDTISRSRFLTSMSRTYYGDYHFWVYIYEENKDFLENPNAIPPGTVVVIPPAEKYGIDKNDPESLKAAIDKAAEIMKPYER